MGIHNREYLRDDFPPSGSFGGSLGGSGGGPGGPISAVKALVILNVAVFLVTWLVPFLGSQLELPATFSVARKGAVIYSPESPESLSGVEVFEGGYVVPLQSGRDELPWSKDKFPGATERFEELRRDDLDNWVSAEAVVADGGGRFLVTGMIRRSDIGTIWWQFPWRLITYGFCHDRSSLFHLAFNMICLWMFGRLIEGIYGRREFLWIYLLGVLLSGVCHLAWQLASGGDATPMVGASGGVMAVMVLSAIHFPKMKVLLFMIIPVELGILIVGLVAMDVLRATGVFGGDTHIAYMAHLGGAAFGFVYFRSGVRLSTRWESQFGQFRLWRRRVARPSVRVYQPPVDGFDDQVDAILEKISREGEASLTDRERELLMEA
ncbi:MAG TPA: hypothetical protein DCE47_21680, partial [Planctomycetaceae bacterium]|nr:hypothetical protein [Planctomycetaceae bacterium]